MKRSIYLGCFALLSQHVYGQSSSFTYQGRLNEGANPANGSYDLRFAIYDAASSGAQQGAALTNSATAVSNGLFSVMLDFGNQFPGANRWLEIALRTNAGGFLPLTPRQLIGSAPYSVRAANFSGAVADGQLSGNIPRLNSANTFAAAQTLASGSQSLLTLNGTNTSGTWLNLVNGSAGGKTWNLISTGPTNGEGAGKLLFRESSYGVAMTLASGGSVGIGTTSPGNPLDVTAAGTVNGGVPGFPEVVAHFKRSTVGHSAVSLDAPAGLDATAYFAENGSPIWGLRNDSSDTNKFQLRYHAGGLNQPVITFATNGNVGIGTTTPQANLDVAGTIVSSAFKLTAGVTANAVLTSDASGLASWQSGLRLLSAYYYPCDFCAGQPASPNLIGGHPANSVSNGVIGATVLGGGPLPGLISTTTANSAAGDFATVAGGTGNQADGDFSFAAGRQALAKHQGSFVWADSQTAAWPSTASNQFLIRAQNGVGINTTNTSDAALTVAGHTHINDYDIFFRGGADQNHGVGWYQSFAGTNIDGPVLYGWSGGALATRNGGNKMALRWNSAGEVFVNVLNILGGADLAEPFEMPEETPKGAVMVIDEDHPGELKVSSVAYDTRVAGIVSGANGVEPGLKLRQEGALDHGQHVALNGRVYALADATGGAIKPGDLLTTSDTPGHAMRVSDPARAPGAVIGKAMSALKAGRGYVLVLVSLQ